MSCTWHFIKGTASGTVTIINLSYFETPWCTKSRHGEPKKSHNYQNAVSPLGIQNGTLE
jgi:hypothetical protein